MVKIYLADITLYQKRNKSTLKAFLVKDVVCKRIPIMFHLNEGDVFKRATRGFSDTFIKTLDVKFDIHYKKEING